jgi:carotenoid cleavage dioxygenase
MSTMEYVDDVIDAAGQVTRTTDIPVADGPMMHDFGLTEKYVVLYDLPVTFSLDAVVGGVRMPYTWNPAHQPRVGLLPRDGAAADVRWLEVDPCWVFHTLNACDDGSRIVVDLCQYQSEFESRRSGPARAGDARPVDHRSGRRQGDRAAPR